MDFRKLKLELLTPDNIDHVKAIHREDISEAWVDNADVIMEYTQYGLEHGCIGHTYAILWENVYIGVILLGEAIPWESDPQEMREKPFYRLIGFIIDNRYRSFGIGGYVLETVIKRIYDEYGIRPIALGVHKDNIGAARFYERHGFVKTEAMEGNDCYYIRYPQIANTDKTIKTERLILRPLTIADADDAYEWLADPQVTRFMSYLRFTSKQQVEEWLASIKDEANIFAYCLADGGKVIGSGGIAYHAEEKAYRLGYNINRAYWGKGYATEAAGAMLKWAYTELGARDFCCHHANANVASQNVIHKLGFIFDHYGQFSKYDNSETFDASFYVMHLD